LEVLLLDLAIKGTIVLTATGALARWALNRSSAAARHLVWSVGLASLVALPVLSQSLPRWHLGILPAEPGNGAAGPAAVSGTPWTAWIVWAWLAGVGAVLAAILIGRVRVWWLARSSEPLDRGPWPALATVLCGEIDVRRRVTLRQTRRVIMPMMWGFLRPVILLPGDADRWPAGLRRDVLLHELAHVKRHDCLTQLVARLACALHWFNPLVWLAARRLRLERERACDDHVLQAGASVCDYAEHLLAVARTRMPERAHLALGMAGHSHFAERLAALLDGRRRRAVLSLRLVLPTGMAAACLVLPLAALEPESRSLPAVALAPADADVGPHILVPPPSVNARAIRHPPDPAFRAAPGVVPTRTPERPKASGESEAEPPRKPAVSSRAVAPSPTVLQPVEVVIEPQGVVEFVLAADRTQRIDREKRIPREIVAEIEAESCTESKRKHEKEPVEMTRVQLVIRAHEPSTP
jgi:beta-lactamase regulating signal transducer with metallopeptidase domain